MGVVGKRSTRVPAAQQAVAADRDRAARARRTTYGNARPLTCGVRPREYQQECTQEDSRIRALPTVTWF